MIASRGEEVVCISVPDYVRGITILRRYIVNDVKTTVSSVYYKILDDDDYGRWFVSTLFAPIHKQEPVDGTGWAESVFDPPAKSDPATAWSMEAALKPIHERVIRTVKNWQGTPDDPWNGKTVTLFEPFDDQPPKRESSGGQWRYDELRWRKDNK